jgi:carboxyvinyl-carboxyphosphonate phosphorylmutase
MTYLGSQRVRVCIQTHLPIIAATRAIYETMRAMRDGVAAKDVAGLASADLMKQVTRDADYRCWIKEFLGD